MTEKPEERPFEDIIKIAAGDNYRGSGIRKKIFRVLKITAVAGILYYVFKR